MRKAVQRSQGKGQELYVCIALAYIIQEYDRFSLLLFARLTKPKTLFWNIGIQILISVVMSTVLVSGAMYIYFYYFLGYTPNLIELVVFNSIFVVITLIYLTLYLSHQFLYRINTKRIADEVMAKTRIEEDFMAFKKGINPDLLFESLESLIVLMKHDSEEAEQLVDHFSTVYRYILAKKKNELVGIAEEIEVLNELLQLFNYLPYRKTMLRNVSVENTFVVPGTLLLITERIIRSTIAASHQTLAIDISETAKGLTICYTPQDKLRNTITVEDFKDIEQSYRYYAQEQVSVTTQDFQKIITLPKLMMDESSHY